MKAVVLGSTGMLGQALIKEGRERGCNIVGVARGNADINIDVTNDSLLRELISTERPDVLINTVSIVSLVLCEEKPSYAYMVNSRPASILGDICHEKDVYYVHISTDHYFTGDKEKPHDEASPIKILNEYARTKYAGERFALLNADALVIRTNIVGFRGIKDQPTFVEWVIQSLEKKVPLTLFDDFFTSSIHVKQFSSTLFDIINKQSKGVLNLASRDVCSKKVFIEAVAARMGYSIFHAKTGSVLNMSGVPRAESLGLDINKAEAILGYRLPSMMEVVDSLISEYKEIGHEV